MWVSVTIPLVENLHRQGHTVQLSYAYSGRSMNTVGNVYVENVDLITVGFHSEEPFGNVLSSAQGTTSSWQGGLQATGGDLKWEKSKWCSAEFTWDLEGQWCYKQLEELVGDIRIKGPNGKDITMQRKGPTDTKVAVGATQVVDGSMDGQMEFLLGKIEDFGKAFWDSWVPRKRVNCDVSEHASAS